MDKKGCFEKRSASIPQTNDTPTCGGTPLHWGGRGQTCDLGTVAVKPKSNAKTHSSPELSSRSSLARHHCETVRHPAEWEEWEKVEGEGREGEGPQNAAYTSPAEWTSSE